MAVETARYVYIVVGISGEYSYWRTWDVAAYLDEAQANLHCQRLLEVALPSQCERLQDEYITSVGGFDGEEWKSKEGIEKRKSIGQEAYAYCDRLKKEGCVLDPKLSEMIDVSTGVDYSVEKVLMPTTFEEYVKSCQS